MLISCAVFFRFRGLTYSTKVVIESPNLFSVSQIEKAADNAKSYFGNNFSGCILNTLTFNDRLSEHESNTYATNLIVFDAKYSVYWATETNVVGDDNFTQISVKYDSNNTVCDVSAGVG